MDKLAKSRLSFTEPDVSLAQRSTGNLVIDNVSKVFERRANAASWGIRNLSVKIEAGQFCAIIGASGCGKSTLLKLIAGLIPPTRGVISVDGITVRKPGADRGMVFQEYAVFPWLTVAGNVAFPLKVAGIPKIERRTRAQELIKIVGLDGAERKYPRELSGGMRQRVAVARALANDPAVLLMDEPFAAVDALNRQELQEQILQTWSVTGSTVVFVTHSVDEAIFLADRIVVLKPAGACDSSLLADLDVELTRPRSWAGVQGDEHFHRLRKRLLELLRTRSSSGSEATAEREAYEHPESNPRA